VCVRTIAQGNGCLVGVPARVLGPNPPSATRDPNAPIPQGYRIQIPGLQIDLPIAEGDLTCDVDQLRLSTPDLRALRYVITDVRPRVPPVDVPWVPVDAGRNS
jgi:hypothetical protein